MARSQVFHQVMGYLDIEVRTHLPRGPEDRRTTARAQGKVERPFRTVKEMQETLYHFHEPQPEDEATAGRCHCLLRYNAMPHRSEPQTRMEDWLQPLPPEGLRAMGRGERCGPFARAPARRQGGLDAPGSGAGGRHDVEPDLAGATGLGWFGLYDAPLYVEQGARRYGP